MATAFDGGYFGAYFRPYLASAAGGGGLDPSLNADWLVAIQTDSLFMGIRLGSCAGLPSNWQITTQGILFQSMTIAAAKAYAGPEVYVPVRVGTVWEARPLSKVITAF